MDLQGRRVLLTGASGGIGNTIARTLHRHGATVILSGRRADALETLRNELGERAEVVQADLASTARGGGGGGGGGGRPPAPPRGGPPGPAPPARWTCWWPTRRCPRAAAST